MEPLNFLEIHRDEPIKVPPIKKITYVARGCTSPRRYIWQLGESGYLKLLVGLGNDLSKSGKPILQFTPARAKALVAGLEAMAQHTSDFASLEGDTSLDLIVRGYNHRADANVPVTWTVDGASIVGSYSSELLEILYIPLSFCSDFLPALRELVEQSPSCDCSSEENQVCDICQNVAGKTLVDVFKGKEETICTLCDEKESECTCNEECAKCGEKESECTCDEEECANCGEGELECSCCEKCNNKYDDCSCPDRVGRKRKLF